MEIVLKGKIKKGVNIASKRINNCKPVLEKYGLIFPPLFLGTINIQLKDSFPTPNWPNVVHVACAELDAADPIRIEGRAYRECWELIPVIRINDLVVPGYIYRTTTNYHGDKTIELITENLATKINLAEGNNITVVVTDGM